MSGASIRTENMDTRMSCGAQRATSWRFSDADSFSPTRRLTSNVIFPGLVGIDDDVIAVQNFAVENLKRQRILHQLLNARFSGRAPKFGS